MRTDQMKIIKNTSGFETKKLKSLYCYIHALMSKSEGRLPQWKTLKVEIRSKSFGYSGRAYLGKVFGTGWDMFLSMSNKLSIEQISQLFAHELMHSYGYDHNQYRTNPLDEKQIELIKSKYNVEDLLIKDSPKETQVNVVAKNYKKLKLRKANLLKKQQQYQSNLKRIDNSMKKVERQLGQYEKKYDNERLTAERIPTTKRKKGKHPKQVCKELCEKHDWLHIYHDDWFEDELVIEVYDKDNYDDSNEVDWDDRYETWKQAKEVALKLIKEKNNA